MVPEDNWDLESNSSGLSSYSEEDEGEELHDKEMEKYMRTMDKELLETDVPLTSVDQPTRKVARCLNSAERELNSRYSAQESVLSEGCESFSDVENFQPVKIDSAALESLLASYTMQYGQPGPASTLLRQLSLKKQDD